MSDADMCDAIGVVGIERALVYACHHGGRIFDPAVWPNVNLAAHEYNADGNTHDTDGFINHFFEAAETKRLDADATRTSRSRKPPANYG